MGSDNKKEEAEINSRYRVSKTTKLISLEIWKIIYLQTPDQPAAVVLAKVAMPTALARADLAVFIKLRKSYMKNTKSANKIKSPNQLRKSYGPFQGLFLSCGNSCENRLWKSRKSYKQDEQVIQITK